MSRNQILLCAALSILIQPAEPSFAALGTHVRICSVKGTVRTQLRKEVTGSWLDEGKQCSLTQSLKRTECRVFRGSAALETGPDGYAYIEFLGSDKKLKVEPGTKLFVERNSVYVHSGTSWFKVERTAAGEFVVRTPTVITGVRGTEFVVDVADDGTSILRLIEGQLEVSDLAKKDTLVLSAGMEILVTAGSRPSAPVPSRIADDEKWWTDWPTLVPIAEIPPDTPGGTDPPAGSGQQATATSGQSPRIVKGNWTLTCIGIGEVFIFEMNLDQSGNSFHGQMRRTNGNEPLTKVEGTILPDGSIDFVRSTGNWKQHYIGGIVEQSAGRAIRLEGRFGNMGDEKYQWNASSDPGGM